MSETSVTKVDEIGARIYRISTPVPPAAIPGGFTFNQFLVDDDEPLLFHTGLRRMFPAVREAVGRIIDPQRLRWIAFSHVEADECGSLNEWLAAAPHAAPLCGRVAAIVQMNDLADRAPRALDDGEAVTIGRHRLRWLDTPHLPHAWECGFMFDETSGTLFCGDLFTQGGAEGPALTRADILEPSEQTRHAFDYYSRTRDGRALIEKLAATAPRTLACMHGSSWEGDGAALLRALGERLDAD